MLNMIWLLIMAGLFLKDGNDTAVAICICSMFLYGILDDIRREIKKGKPL